MKTDTEVALRLLILILILLASCGHPVAVRDAVTYSVEIAAAQARQLEAADALEVAASRASEAGDWAACVEYAGPALLIRAAARHQANRALWLARLPYADESGTTPDIGTEQPDPGPAPAIAPVESLCGFEE